MPKRIPNPTANSPQVTRKEKNPALGSTMCCKTHAYHPWTAGFAPELLANAPAANPASAFPLVPQAGEIIFSHPARSHSAPTYIRTTNHSTEEPSEPKKNFEIAGSGNGSVEETAFKAGRSFFFSSRRRHTRFDCDWSSDVCSSDLGSHVYLACVFHARGHVALDRDRREVGIELLEPVGRGDLRFWRDAAAAGGAHGLVDRKSVV